MVETNVCIGVLEESTGTRADIGTKEQKALTPTR